MQRKAGILARPLRATVASCLFMATALLVGPTNAFSEPGYITTVAGSGTSGFSGDGGPAASAQLLSPQGVSFDSAGNMYITDTLNGRIRKVDTNGIIRTVAGGGSTFGDNGPATSAALARPSKALPDNAGNLYIVDTNWQRIRKVDASGIIRTVAGNGQRGYSGDGLLATSASLFDPSDIAFDKDGNLLIADKGNNRIRKVGADGRITTVAGNGTGQPSSGDGGPAMAAQFRPTAITVDTAGNLYISDPINNYIRKVDTQGIISTVAGNGQMEFSGDNGPATRASFYHPNGIAVDKYGNMYISDVYNYRIRKVDTCGTVTTFAGAGPYGSGFGFAGDGGPATTALISQIDGNVAIDANGNVFIPDAGNNRIREVFAQTSVPLKIYQKGTGTGTATANDLAVGFTATDWAGRYGTAAFPLNTMVTVAVTPGSNSTFAGWSGACTGTDSCTVDMTTGYCVTATFNTATPINGVCGPANGQAFSSAPTSGLCSAGTATAVAGTGPWNWSCTGLYGGSTTACSASVNAYNLTVTVNGSGSGTVHSSPGIDINCPGACNNQYPVGTNVSLTTSAAQGSYFTAWSGACTGTAPCQLIMNQDKSVGATFIADTTGPALTCPADLKIEATSSAGATATFKVTAKDDFDPSPVVTCSATSGATFPIFPNDTTVVTCTGKDESNNSGSCAFSIKVQDTIAPVIIPPANVTVEATGPLTQPSLGTPTTSDAVGVASIYNDAPKAGFSLGNTPVIWYAVDAAGNTGHAATPQAITVRDTTPPYFEKLNNLVKEATSPAGAVASYNVIARDLVDPAPRVSCSIPSGGTFPLGTTTVTCTATDASGNSVNGSFTVKVQDTTPPVLTVPSDVTLVLNTALTSTAVQSFLNGARATDLVDQSVAITATTPALNSVGPKVVTFTAFDDFGNQTVNSATINVVYGCGDTYLNNQASNYLTPVNLQKPFKQGSTVPVKLHLCDANGANVLNAVARLYAQSVAGEQPVGDRIEATSTSGDDTENYFRVAGNQYMYNLATKPIASGSYQLQAVLDDGTTRTIPFSLK